MAMNDQLDRTITQSKTFYDYQYSKLYLEFSVLVHQLVSTHLHRIECRLAVFSIVEVDLPKLHVAAAKASKL